MARHIYQIDYITLLEKDQSRLFALTLLQLTVESIVQCAGSGHLLIHPPLSDCPILGIIVPE